MTISSQHNMRNYFKFLFVLLSVGSLNANANDTTKVNKEGSHDFQISKSLDIFNSVVKELDLFYVDTIKPEKTVEKGIRYMLSSTDPYTTYFAEREMQDLKFMTTGSYAGVGAIISVNEKKQVFISEIYEGKPAYKAGLRAGDVFVSVDEVATDGKTTDAVSKMLRGEPKTITKVVVDRPNKGIVKTDVLRENIIIDPITYYAMVAPQVGYICMSSFTDQSYDSFEKAYNSLKSQGMKKLVFDLRDNPGGLLSEATKIINMFVPKGTKLVYTKGKEKRWNSEYWSTMAPVDTTIPIAVLVSNNSASAAEIVSGSLQDLDRAVIVGERTYGKGLVQTTRDLPYGGSLKVTISKYHIPSGRCIQAIDYAKRDENGTVKRIPDSLTHEFKTAHGRIVRDGCGISPDVYTPREKNAPITYSLYAKNIIFNFVTDHQKNDSKMTSVDDIRITDNIFNDFKEYVKKSGFTYKTKSEDGLKTLIEIAEKEGMDKYAKAQFDSLKAHLKPNLEAELDSNKADISKFIAIEMARRNFYQKGAMAQSLKGDNALQQAINILQDDKQYKDLLRKAIVGDEREKQAEAEAHNNKDEENPDENDDVEEEN